MRWASTVVRRSSHSTGLRPVASSTRWANSRYSWARGPSVPSMFLGNPMTTSSTWFSRTSRASSSSTTSAFRLWMVVAVPASRPVGSEMATPVWASP